MTELDQLKLRQGGVSAEGRVAHFVDRVRECRVARGAVAVFDTSPAGKLILTGDDVPQVMQNVTTNEVRDLPLGGGAEAFFSNNRARALFLVQMYHVMHGTSHAYWVESAPGQAGDLATHIDRLVISEDVTVTNVTDDFAQLHLAGPEAHVVVALLTGSPWPDLAPFQHVNRVISQVGDCQLRARPLLGLPGVDLVVPVGRGAALWEVLTSSGVVPAGEEAFEVLRVEAGTPKFGADYDQSRFVMEVGHAARAVSYSKGCYPGQEPIVMARDRAGRVNNHFVRLKCDSPIAPGTPLTHGEREVGRVTSAAESDLHGPIALGYVRWDASTPGTTYDAAGVGATCLGA